MKLKMRPDEHKKKKNTQYKKRHGISEKENKIKEDPRNKTNVQDQKAKLTNVNGAESKEFQQSDKTKDKVKLEETDEVSKHYGKRKLESNWSRSEDDSDSEVEDDLPLQRGEDFNKLLAQAGGSASQFRLKDEEEWNVEGSDTSPALALDLDSLSQSLDCIPLHERLGIKENVFTEEQIIEMKGYSADVEQKYRTTFPIASNKNKSKNSGQESAGIVTNNNDSSAKETDFVGKTSVKTANITTVTNDKEKPKAEINEIKHGKNEHKTTIKNTEVESLEDDLDMILSLDGSKDETANIVKKVDKKVHKDQQKDEVKGTSDDIKVSNNVTEKVNNSKGNENLEDWLDSMLDD